MQSAFRFVIFFILLVTPIQHAFSKPGDIISIKYEQTMAPNEIDKFIKREFFGTKAPKASYSVDIFWVKFESTYPDEEKAIAQAQVFIPNFTIEESSRDRVLYIFAPGTTGLIENCRPSREHLSSLYWGYFRQYVLANCGQGYIGIIPDYLGFEDPDRSQYYLLSKAEGAVILDSVRALKNVIKELNVPNILNTKTFIAGFCQGGHASYAAADYNDSYAPEQHIDGIIGFGPCTDILPLFRFFPSVAPMVLYTYRNFYGKDIINPDTILATKYAKTLDEDLESMCVGGIQTYYPFGPYKLYKKAFANALITNNLEKQYPELYNLLQENKPGLSGHGIPSLICQSDSDSTIPFRFQEQYAKDLQKSGSPVTLNVYKNAPHDCKNLAFFDVQKWIENICPSLKEK